MTINYGDVVRLKYGVNEGFEFEIKPKIIDGFPSIDPDDEEIVITHWDLPDPQPTIEELDAYAKSREYLYLVLSETKEEGMEEIYQITESERGKYITLKPGKIDEYARKKEEYTKWVQVGKPANPDPADYPIAGAEGAEYDPPLTMVEMLRVWGNRSNTWAIASAKIAKLERRALVAMSKITKPQQKQTILDALRQAFTP